MNQLSDSDERLLSAISRLAYCNPFSPQRIELEQEILRNQFVADYQLAWSRNVDNDKDDRPNVPRLLEVITRVVQSVQAMTEGGSSMPVAILEQYWDAATYVLFYRHIAPSDPDTLNRASTIENAWKSFQKEYQQLSAIPGLEVVDVQPVGHLFACLCQVHRAFMNIYRFILGDSLPSVQLRATVWQSVFTHDLRRYRRTLYSRMSALPSLITGPSGTGKELVARAIGLSQYIPFDEKNISFLGEESNSFFALNLSALSATLIESELFGHCKGAFTGAVNNRQGWLELCQPHGAIFLDEIGELDPALQVKLLRVVQNRTYSRLGEAIEKTFSGKIIGATNRDMSHEIEAGRFREDLYYRLCADRIQTPGLREQLDDRPDDIRALTLFIARSLAGEDAEELSELAVKWIEQNLGDHYPWRGNIRELQQCVSGIMIRNDYVPPDRESVNNSQQASDPSADLNHWVKNAAAYKLTVDQLTQKYCTWVYHQEGSYERAATRLGVDRRTVKSRLDPIMLEQLQEMDGRTE